MINNDIASLIETDWPVRCQHWINEARTKHRARRERRKEPLVLCGHGVFAPRGWRIVVHSKRLHALSPETRGASVFSRGDLSLPPRIIMLDGSGSISFDVLAWLSEQGVPLVRIDWQGHVQTVLADAGYAANPHRLLWQIETRADPRRRMGFLR